MHFAKNVINFIFNFTVKPNSIEIKFEDVPTSKMRFILNNLDH